MFHLLDDLMEAHLRSDVPLDAAVDVSFARPNREWSSTLNRPTVNVCLWGIGRDAARATSGVETVARNGAMVRRPVSPRVRVTYVVSAWSGDERDEHILLGRLLGSVLRHRTVPAEHVPTGLLPERGFVEMMLGGGEGNPVAEFWRSVDAPFHPGIVIDLSLPVELGGGVPVGPPVDSAEVRVSDTNRATRTSMRSRAFVEEGGPHPA